MLSYLEKTNPKMKQVAEQIMQQEYQRKYKWKYGEKDLYEFYPEEFKTLME